MNANAGPPDSSGSDSAPAERDRRRAARRAVEFVLDGRRARLVLAATTSFLGGLTEAGFLVGVTRVGFAISDGDEEVDLGLGMSLSVGGCLSALLGLIILRALLAVVAMAVMVRLSNAVVATTRRDIADAFLMASWTKQQQQRTGSLQELLTTFSAQVGGLSGAVTSLILAITNLAAMLTLAVFVDPIGALVLITTVVVLSRLILPFRKRVWGTSHKANLVGMDFATTLNETSQLGLELHVFNVQGEARHRLEHLIDASEEQSRKRGYAQGSIPIIYSGLAYLALVGALVVVATINSVDLTALGAVMLVMLRSLSYGQAIQNGLSGISATSPAVLQLRTILDDYHTSRRQDGGALVGDIGTLEFEKVSFSYTADQPVLNDISFTIAPHEIVGIVGPSGGGKSTLVQLMLGLRDPDHGRILADGQDTNQFLRSGWARKVTFVPQTAHLIAGTVADNIRFLRNDVGHDEIERAARLAHLHDDVVGFPEGYERQVGESGGQLSGGQQQRLCIARALVEQPDILVLDEPTSALDVRSEHLIRTTLLSLRERMTVIVIAHRLSTLDMCDRIMVIQEGRLRAFDTPERLEADNEFFREALRLSGMR